LAAGLRPDPLGKLYSAPPDTPAVIRGRERGKGNERVGNEEAKEGERRKGVGKDGKGNRGVEWNWEGG